MKAAHFGASNARGPERLEQGLGLHFSLRLWLVAVWVMEGRIQMRISSYNVQTSFHHGIQRKWHERCVGSATYTVAVAITLFWIIVL